MPSEPVLQLAVAVAIVIGLITALLLLQVVWLTGRSHRRDQQRNLLEQRWRPLLAAAALDDGGEPPLPALRAGEQADFMVLWCRLQRTVRGRVREQLNGLFRRLGLETVALRHLSGRRVRHRLVALQCFRYLADERHWDVIADCSRDDNRIVAMVAAQTLVALNPMRAMRRLIPLYQLRTDWPRRQMLGLCRQAGPRATTGPLLDALQTADPRTEPERCHRLLALLPAAESSGVADWARAHLEDADTEVAIAAMHCLAVRADPRDRDRILLMLQHPEASRRAAAIVALGGIAETGDQQIFLSLLCDPDWSVRQLAGHQLASLPGLTPAQLDQLLQSIDDRFGREALAAALGERRS